MRVTSSVFAIILTSILPKDSKMLFMTRFHRLGDRDPRKDFYINKAILLYRFSGFKNPKISISLYEFSEKG